MSEEIRKSPWNSLEVVKIATSILTPLVLLWLGIQFNSATARNAQMRERESQVIRKRIELWDKMGRPINDIFCFGTKLGNYRELTEEGVTKEKIDLDTLVYTYRPFFSDEFFKNYQAFVNTVFDGDYHRQNVNTAQVVEKNYALMKVVGKELDVIISPPSPIPDSSPSPATQH